MYSKDDKEYFRANIWGMQILRDAMYRAGVVLDIPKEREIFGGEQKTIECLYGCFCSNDGWYVLPEECKEIADKLERTELHKVNAFRLTNGKLETEEKELDKDLKDFIRSFAEFCRKVSDVGFYVW